MHSNALMLSDCKAALHKRAFCLVWPCICLGVLPYALYCGPALRLNQEQLSGHKTALRRITTSIKEEDTCWLKELWDGLPHQR
eukprot:scaffold15741_cov21-Tisochrysis_lutea.AAC.2